MADVELVLERRGEIHRAIPVDGAVSIGRGPDNDVVIPDPMVSWRHAVVWMEFGAPWVRDVGSRNGTLLDGEPVRQAEPLADGASIGVGPLTLRVRVLTGPRGQPSYRTVALEDVTNGVRYPLPSERFVLGDGDGVDLRVSGLAEQATLLVQADGEVWLGQGTDDTPLEHGEIHQLGSLRFRIVPVGRTHHPTLEADARGAPYRIEATLDGPLGPEARIVDPQTGRTCQFEAENRAVFVFLLARAVTRDLGRGVPHTERGWLSDDDIVSGVWGRIGEAEGAVRLKSLVHRVRSDCRAAGLDPWCIEKRRRATRIRCAVVRLDPAP